MKVDQEKIEKLEQQKAHQVVAWAMETYGNKIALASSFGAEDVVLIHMMAQVSKDAHIFTLDTGRLPEETYEVMDAIRDRYGVKIETYFPERVAVEKMVAENGFNLMYKSIDLRKSCCHVRKVEPLKRALSGLDAWITGLRREQSVTRTEINKVEWDEANGLVKVNPIADWSEADVWRFIRVNVVPYNKLHDQGYPSIGCAPCTRAISRIDDVRAGRWWWEDPEKKECGLHVKND